MNRSLFKMKHRDLMRHELLVHKSSIKQKEERVLVEERFCVLTRSSGEIHMEFYLFMVRKFIMIMFALIITGLLTLAWSQTAVSPTWNHDPNFQAGTSTLVSSQISNPFDNTYTINFLNPTTSNPPYLAMGLKSYTGDNFLLQQDFTLTVTYHDNAQMQVRLQLIYFSTIPSLLSISYIMVEQSYPYEINMFYNVDINYSTPLQNVSVVSTSLQSHTEVVDFSGNQAQFYPHNSFSAPFSNYKILFFLTTLHITSTTLIPLYIDLSYAITNASAYSMTLTVGYQLSIYRFSFSQVFFNVGDYQSTISPYLYGLQWNVTNYQASTNIIYFNSVTINQILVGLISIYSTTGQVRLEFNAQFGTYNGSYGMQLLPPTGTEMVGVKVSVLYMMNWDCPLGYPYLNIITRLCQDLCGYYTYVNITDMTCRPCLNTICYTCDNITDSTICLSCPPNFVLSNNTCICSMTALDRIFYSASTCSLCSTILPYCTQCSYTQNTSLPYNSSAFLCLDCNNAAGYFIDANNLCSTCSIPNCVTCSGISQCSVCNTGYGVTSSGSCSNCPITGCNSCVNISYCGACNSGYVLSNGACTTCAAACTCGGYAFPRKSNGDCSTICGDGILIFPYQECDDGNSISGDGCSSACMIEAYSTCGGQPSECFLNRNIEVELIGTEVSESDCNTITFEFKILPQLVIFQVYPTDWSKFVSSPNSSLTYIPSSIRYSKGLLSVSYTYNKTLQNQQITFNINPVGVVNSTYLSTVSPFTATIKVRPTNNLAAIYCSDGTCKLRKSSNTYATAQSTIAYIGLFFSVFSLKIVGLQMFGVLQLSVLILSDYDYVNPLLIGILGHKEVNGINIDSGTNGSSKISSRVKLNGYINQVFLENFNVMFYLTFGLAILGLLLYNVTYFINKSAGPNLNSSLEEEVHSASHSERAIEQSEPKQSKSQRLHRYSKYLLKEVLMTFLLFNMLNLGFSAGLQIKYIDVVDAWSILAMLLSFTLIIALIIAQFVTDRQEFGEYLDKFKQQRLQSNYISISLVFRFILGLLISLLNEWPQNGLVLVLLGGSYLGYIFHSEPFLDASQNIRSKAVHCVLVLVLFVAYYYRMEAKYDEVSSSYFLFPAYLQLSVVGLVVIGSTLNLGYQLYQRVREMLSGGKGADAAAQKEVIFQTEAKEGIEKENQVVRGEVLDN